MKTESLTINLDEIIERAMRIKTARIQKENEEKLRKRRKPKTK